MSTITREEIAAEAGLRLVEAAVARARDEGLEVCAALCDPRGHLVALARTDNVVAPAIEYAIDKAWTAATLNRSTEGFFERAHARPALGMGLANRPRVLVFPGGQPIRRGDACLGGLGVSGAQDHEDVAIACAVIAEAGFGTEGG